MGKLFNQLEYTQKESFQVITLHSGKEFEKDLNKTKRVVDDDNDGVEIEEVDVRSKNNDKCVKNGNKEDVIPPKDDEPRVDVKTIPFP